jgi:hypothetical protein
MRDMLDGLCGSCHGAEAIREGNVQGGFDSVNDFDRMVTQGLIVPLSSADSPLFQVMRDGSMPPPGIEPRATSRDTELLGQFIDNPLFWDVPVSPSAVDAGPPNIPADAGADGG